MRLNKFLSPELGELNDNSGAYKVSKDVSTKLTKALGGATIIALTACGGGSGGGNSSENTDNTKKIQLNTSSSNSNVEVVTADGGTTLGTFQTDSDGNLVLEQSTLDQALSDNGLGTDVAVSFNVVDGNERAVKYNNLSFTSGGSEYSVDRLTTGVSDSLTSSSSGFDGANEGDVVKNVGSDANNDGSYNTVDISVQPDSDDSSYAKTLKSFVKDFQNGNISISDSEYNKALKSFVGLNGPYTFRSPSENLTEGNTITIDTSDNVGSYGFNVTVNSAPSQVTTNVNGKEIDVSLASGSISSNTSGDFKYTVVDNNGNSVPNTQTINLIDSSDNEAPTADNFTYANSGIAFNSAQTFNWNDLSNASDPNGDSLSASVDASPSHGSVSITGNDLTYTPDSGYEGSDSFDLKISDGNGGNTIITVTIENIDTVIPSVTDSNEIDGINTLGQGVSFSGKTAFYDEKIYQIKSAVFFDSDGNVVSTGSISPTGADSNGNLDTPSKSVDFEGQTPTESWSGINVSVVDEAGNEKSFSVFK